MQLDPVRWFVAFAGAFSDWVITREWKRFALCMIPVWFFVLLFGAASWSGRTNRSALAQRYLELGEKEIESWENAMFPQAQAQVSEEKVQAEGDVAQVSENGEEVNQSEAAESGVTAEETATEGQEKPNLTRYAEMLFERVQLLEPTERSQFITAAMLAHRGAFEQSKAILTRLAPEKGSGYVPAHVLLADILLVQSQVTPLSEAQAQILQHHLIVSADWDRCPEGHLRALGELSRILGDPEEALRNLKRAADRNPENYMELTKIAKDLTRLENDSRKKRIFRQTFEMASAEAEQHYLGKIQEDPSDERARILLAQAYILGIGSEKEADSSPDTQKPVENKSDAKGQPAEESKSDLQNRLEKAETVLLEAPGDTRTAAISRALSNLYLVHYDLNTKWVNGRASVNLGFLDAAMQADPNNPIIAEKVADLVRMQGPKPSDEMIELLKKRLAEGSATMATHATLAKMRIARDEHEKAVPHLEQIVTRFPNSAEELNNLAFILADKFPDRLDESLKYANRAVLITTKENPPNADYYDTLGFVLSKMDRSIEAISVYEMAISIDPKRPDFHQRIAVEYRKLGDVTMAMNHEDIVVRLKKEFAEQAAQQNEGAQQDETAAVAEGEQAEQPEQTSPVEQAEQPENQAKQP